MGIGTAATIIGTTAAVGSAVSQGVATAKSGKQKVKQEVAVTPEQIAIQLILTRYLLDRIAQNRQAQTFTEFLAQGARPGPLPRPTLAEAQLLGLGMPGMGGELASPAVRDFASRFLGSTR